MPVLPTLRLGSSGHYVRLLQMGLDGLGENYNSFSINGYLDPKTDDVVKNFQDRFKLPRDGIVGPKTWTLLLDNVSAIQRLLNSRGYHVGNVDGFYGARTRQAVERFQRDQGLTVTGTFTPRTRQRLFNPNDRDHYELRPSSNSLSSLDPSVANMARRFLTLTREQSEIVH